MMQPERILVNHDNHQYQKIENREFICLSEKIINLEDHREKTGNQSHTTLHQQKEGIRPGSVEKPFPVLCKQ